MFEKYPIIYFTGKLNEVFPIVINVSIQVSSAGKMLPDLETYSIKMFSAQHLRIKIFLDTEVSRK